MCVCVFLSASAALQAQNTPATATYKKIKASLDDVPAIDTHDHLFPFDKLPGYVETEMGKGMNLAGLWRNSYLTRIKSITPWQPGTTFDGWWAKAKHDFDDVRAASFYRYQAEALRDLYGVDFDRISDEQARDLNQKIFRNYVDKRWLYEVVTEKANIELMFNDPYWARFDFKIDYPFGVLVLNVTTMIQGHHADEFKNALDSPYEFAKQHKIDIKTLDDYLRVLDLIFAEAKRRGAVVIKTTLAYRRTLSFERVSHERAAKVFGKRRDELNEADIKAFEDFIMWKLAGLSAKHELPFQIHTGNARIQGSNPILLVDYIDANPKTKFILFHGGYPWVGETGAIAMRYPNHVWVDSCWLPTISYYMAKRAFHEWLDVMPSTKILWGADCNHAEGIYGATLMTRKCLAEVLAERVDRGELTMEHAERIGRQILRDNALALFPSLKDRLWRSKGKKLTAD